MSSMPGGLEIDAAAMEEAAREAAAVMRLLSNPSRLLILCQLAVGEKSVGALEAALGLEQAYVSQQLARLRAQGLVSATRDGRVRRYALSDPRVRPVIETLYQQFCPRPA